MGCGAVETRTGMELVAFQNQEAEVVVMLNDHEDNQSGSPCRARSGTIRL
jgi:hypothetical protein